jgi:hypothetical protein
MGQVTNRYLVDSWSAAGKLRWLADKQPTKGGEFLGQGHT